MGILVQAAVSFLLLIPITHIRVLAFAPPSNPRVPYAADIPSRFLKDGRTPLIVLAADSSENFEDTDDNDNGDNDSDETNDDDMKPKYRSNLQRLTSAQARNNDARNRMEQRRPTNNNNNNSDKKKQQPPKTKNPSKTQPSTPKQSQSQSITEYTIDSFLRGEYDRPFAEEAAAPTPELTPGMTIEESLKALRNLDYPELNHGAAVFMRFCAPLSRSDRWGGGVVDMGGWKELMRGALTPQMLTNRLGQSRDFSVLLEWDTLDVTDGMSVPNERAELFGIGSGVAFVNAALYVGRRFEIVQFTLKKVSGVWLIETAVLSKKEWCVQSKG
jgi:hypothetical protein